MSRDQLAMMFVTSRDTTAVSISAFLSRMNMYAVFTCVSWASLIAVVSDMYRRRSSMTLFIPILNASIAFVMKIK